MNQSKAPGPGKDGGNDKNGGDGGNKQKPSRARSKQIERTLAHLRGMAGYRNANAAEQEEMESAVRVITSNMPQYQKESSAKPIDGRRREQRTATEVATDVASGDYTGAGILDRVGAGAAVGVGAGPGRDDGIDAGGVFRGFTSRGMGYLLDANAKTNVAAVRPGGGFGSGSGSGSGPAAPSSSMDADRTSGNLVGGTSHGDIVSGVAVGPAPQARGGISSSGVNKNNTNTSQNEALGSEDWHHWPDSGFFGPERYKPGSYAQLLDDEDALRRREGRGPMVRFVERAPARTARSNGRGGNGFGGPAPRYQQLDEAHQRADLSAYSLLRSQSTRTTMSSSTRPLLAVPPVPPKLSPPSECEDSSSDED